VKNRDFFGSENKYFESRLQDVPARAQVWKHLVKYFQRFIKPGDSVLELGAGYCHFINNIDSRKKFAVDKFNRLREFANPEVDTFIEDVCNLEEIISEKIDVIFASNLLEHLSLSQNEILLESIKACLKKDGKLILMQPNYRFSFRHYFDDYTHVTAFSHTSLMDLLDAHGFKILKLQKKFMPFSIKNSKIDLSFLIPFYLKFPIKPFAGQMMIVAGLK
jgi:SAM-dependent methyltransferase